MMPSADLLQLLLVDGLFICLAGAMGLWFRVWIKAQQRAMDSRMAALESQQESLERLGARLLAACRSLEGVYASAKHASTADAAVGGLPQHSPLRRSEVERERSRTAAARETTLGAGGGRHRFQGAATGGSGADAGDSGSVDENPARRAGQEGIRGTGFARARDLLAQGLPAKEVARRLRMGMAEVEALKRMMDLEPRSARPGP